jgi:hypothetical protein
MEFFAYLIVDTTSLSVILYRWYHICSLFFHSSVIILPFYNLHVKERTKKQWSEAQKNCENLFRCPDRTKTQIWAIYILRSKTRFRPFVDFRFLKSAGFVSTIKLRCYRTLCAVGNRASSFTTNNNNCDAPCRNLIANVNEMNIMKKNEKKRRVYRPCLYTWPLGCVWGDV